MYDYESLDSVCEHHDVTLPAVILDAARFFRSRQLPNGSIMDDPAVPVFEQWDTLNAVKSLAQWSEVTSASFSELRDCATRFLSASEKANGMVSWGRSRPGRGSTAPSPAAST